uniref:Uncharacterized protein n=1 Tax=Anopheles stephensi TaxID=30069 RepID=A0A182XZZ4_ANOST
MEIDRIADPSSLLGVRLPPDTEIIKYTSSIVGPKVPGTTGRGPKRQRLEQNEYGSGGGSNSGGTGGGSHLGAGGGGSGAGLLPPGLSHHHHQLGSNGGIGGLGPGPTGAGGGGGGGGGGGSNDRIEVIKLPPTITSNGVYSAGKGAGTY